MQTETYRHPFSKAYWRQAASEMKNTRVLVFAALMIALRIVFKSVSIPIAADLRINFGFLVNALGSMVFGPVVAIPAAAITDTLGYLVAPNGVYFFPFIFQEIAGSVIFALFLYRTKITIPRVILSRFAICTIVNLIITTPLMMLYYQMILGKYYAPLDMLRIVKNLALFPAESVLLALLLRAAIPAMRRLGLVTGDTDSLRFTKKNVILLAVLFVIGAGMAAGYAVNSYNTTSLSASYTAEERYTRNEDARSLVTEQNPDMRSPENLVVIIESAYPKFGSNEVTYTAAIYRADPDALAARAAEGGAGLEAVRGYSKSKARADACLTAIGTAQWKMAEGALQSYTQTLNEPR